MLEELELLRKQLEQSETAMEKALADTGFVEIMRKESRNHKTRR